MRRVLPFLLCAAACSRAPQAEASANAATIDCAIGSRSAPGQHCIVAKGGPRELIVRHPDGGFRRLTIADDGYGIVAADGAEPARVTILDTHLIEVAIANHRYRLPATLRARPK